MKKYFTQCKTMEEAKKEYYRLVKIFHPDRGGDAETMKEINNQFDDISEILKNAKTAGIDNENQQHETPEAFRDIIEKLIHIDGLEIEICGTWLWIGGNTYSVKDNLKAAGCKFASKKKKWYWHDDDYIGRKHKAFSMEKIRAVYGSEFIANTPQARLA